MRSIGTAVQEDGDYHTGTERMYAGGSRLRRHAAKFLRRYYFFMRDGLHLTGKGDTVLGCEFVRVVDEVQVP